MVRRIRAGQGDSEIRDAYVAIYGAHILLTPSNGGLGLVAWGVPVIGLVAGAGGIVLALRRWSREPRLAATAADEAIVDQARDRGSSEQDEGGASE